MGYFQLLIYFLLFGSSWCQCTDVNMRTRCVCFDLEDNAGSFRVACNSRSINVVMVAIRSQADSFISSIAELSFQSPSEVVLAAGTFSGLTGLRRLTICCSAISSIEPTAFSNLTELELLDLRDNRLQWLSAASLEGLGSSLRAIYLDNNAFRNLRSDLEPIFTTLQELTFVLNTNLTCDCHLAWLPLFLINNTLRELDFDSVNCSIPRRTPIIDPLLNFGTVECLDFCSLGYHTCGANADCSLQGNDTICTCKEGFSGDGNTCIPLNNPCNSTTLCHLNATCIPVDFTRQTVNCVCDEGFTGNGTECIVIDPCVNTVCHSDATCIPVNQTGMCICRSGFMGDGVNCVSDPCFNVVCNTNAACVDGMCTCDTGFTGSGIECSPVDYCENMQCHPDATCSSDNHNQIGICACNTGFTGDGLSCMLEQTELCLGVMCGVDAMCQADNRNQIGRCVCNVGFRGDGVNCVSDQSCEQVCPDVDGVNVSCLVGSETIQCASQEVQDLRKQLLDLIRSPSPEAIASFTSELATTTSNITYYGDVPVLIDLLVDTLPVISSSSNLNTTIYMDLVNSGSFLLDSNTQSLWSQLNESEISNLVVKLVLGIEDVGKTAFLHTESTTFNITSDNIAIVVIKPGCDNNASIAVSSSLLDDRNSGRSGEKSAIHLPPSVFGTESNCSNVGLVVVIYDGIGSILDQSMRQLLSNMTCSSMALLANGKCSWYSPNSCSNQTVNGVIISASVVTTVNGSSVDTIDTPLLQDPVRITFQHQNLELTGPPTCAFLNEQGVGVGGTFLVDGCSVVEAESSPTHTVCECYHLTSFALLSSPTGSVSNSRSIQIISKVGLSISIICLLMTIMLLFFLKFETKQLHNIHRQLAIALCLAQTLFLVGVDRSLVPSPDAVCTCIAVFLHYLFLCTFSWQLVEGIHLYIFIVKVFYNNEKLKWFYFPLAWGLPAVVVGITLAVQFCDYGSEHYCWITTGNGTNWAFHGPVIVVLLINLVIMVVITNVIVKAARKKEQPQTCLLCTLLHASLVLVPILGINWVLGFFVVGDGTISIIIEWLFSIFTTLQGFMIFLMHCVLNREVRESFLKAIGCHEAAKKQPTMQDLRRSSAAYIRRKSSTGLAQVKNLKFKNALFFKIDKNITSDESGIPFDYEISDFHSVGNFSVDHPSTTQLPQISEEGDGYSLPSSVPATPVL